MKNILFLVFGFLFKILYYLFIQFFLREKVLNFAHGWDTLNPFAPYSYGGLHRKDFLTLYRKMKQGNKISRDEYTLFEYGSLRPSQERINEKWRRSNLIKRFFSFKKP